MITNIAIIPIFVRDIDASKRFYVETLGFQEKDDVSMNGMRWVTVTHPNQPNLQLHLTPPAPPLADDLVAALNRTLEGDGLPGLAMAVDDCRKTFEELSGKGVQFMREPAEQPWGVEALCRDNSGNWIVLIEPPASDPIGAA